jgi:outer membrane immunogenic protein
MTNSFFRAAVGCVALVAASGFAQAADMNRKVPVATPYVAPVSVYNWTGFYAGANLGADWLRSDVNVGGVSSKLTGSSLTGGLQAGYNFQTGPWVLGAEADVGYSRATKTATVGADTDKAEKTWSGTVRARAGYAFDRLLVFGTGGVAWANFKLEDNNGAVLTTKNQTRAGWTLGAGAEYAVAQNISVKGEYLYADYGRVHAGDARQSLSDHVVRLGVNYKF